MKTKTIYWIIGVVIVIGLISWLISRFGKNGTTNGTQTGVRLYQVGGRVGNVPGVSPPVNPAPSPIIVTSFPSLKTTSCASLTQQIDGAWNNVVTIGTQINTTLPYSNCYSIGNTGNGPYGTGYLSLGNLEIVGQTCINKAKEYNNAVKTWKYLQKQYQDMGCVASQ